MSAAVASAAAIGPTRKTLFQKIFEGAVAPGAITSESCLFKYSKICLVAIVEDDYSSTSQEQLDVEQKMQPTDKGALQVT